MLKSLSQVTHAAAVPPLLLHALSLSGGKCFSYLCRHFNKTVQPETKGNKLMSNKPALWQCLMCLFAKYQRVSIATASILACSC